MKELFRPGAKLILAKAQSGNRRTLYDIVGLVKAREKILLDTRLSNSIAEEAILTGSMAPQRLSLAEERISVEEFQVRLSL